MPSVYAVGPTLVPPEGTERTICTVSARLRNAEVGFRVARQWSACFSPPLEGESAF